MTSFFSVPPDADADPGFGLVVYGATPAGILASVVAARAGLRVALLEPSSHLGGMATSGLCATDVSDRRLVRGVVREVFQRCGAAYGRDIEWKAESRVMAVVFRTMLAEAGVVLRLGTPILDLGKIGPRIVWASLAGGRRLHASAWIDATYEGDLLPLADVSHTAGRESRATYGESLAGRSTPGNMLPWAPKARVNPFSEDGRPLRFVLPYDGLHEGDGDEALQAYSFRPTITRDPERRIPFPEPSRYDPRDFELFRAYCRQVFPRGRASIIEKENFCRSAFFTLTTLPNNKHDMNSGHLLPTTLPGLNHGWLKADAAGRRRIQEEYREYTLGVFHFLCSDPSVPENAREFFGRFGLCADEYADSGHFPPMLYVREGRRMVGETVLTQHDVLSGREAVGPDGTAGGDAITVAMYPLDCKPVRFMATEDGSNVVREGMFYVTDVPPYPVPYGIILPKRREASNLLVPVAVSASHVAYCSFRMEPHWMATGAAAGAAAALSAASGVALHDVPASDIRGLLDRPGGIPQLLAQGK